MLGWMVQRTANIVAELLLRLLSGRHDADCESGSLYIWLFAGREANGSAVSEFLCRSSA